MTENSTATALSDGDMIREHIREIDARVTPTIGPTFGSDGNGGLRETREGRIQCDDFQALIGYAMGAPDLADIIAAGWRKVTGG